MTRKGLGDKRNRHDPAYLRAKRENFAGRAIYKLEELDKRFRLIKPGGRVLDLGCWPGSWLQYAVRKTGPEGVLVGVDLEAVEIALPDNVKTFVGDVNKLRLDKLVERYGPFDVVLSDMAPNTTGNKDFDIPTSEDLFLRALEESFGREAFDPFLQAWFAEHRFGSVSTEDFLDFVGKELFGKHAVLEGKTPVDLAAWIDGVGLPEGAPEPVAPALAAVETEAARFAAGEIEAKKIQSKGWSPWLWLHFLRSLPKNVGSEQLAALDEAFAFTKSGNAEILGQWLVLAARVRYEPAYARLEEFLISVGRRKFLTPIYRALAATPEGLEQARAIYAKARPGYHAISRGTIDEIVGAY
ncbi:MAG: leukotriene A4 hydrolase C-terminal domain-containing protein [Myxococcales bacterium]|nr:leukotriene A4 hydrolase C-terminal domain-containing protein [Myxococcales bacterium]